MRFEQVWTTGPVTAGISINTSVRCNEISMRRGDEAKSWSFRSIATEEGGDRRPELGTELSLPGPPVRSTPHCFSAWRVSTLGQTPLEITTCVIIPSPKYRCFRILVIAEGFMRETVG